MSVSSTLTAIRALPAICSEIERLKEPANPALPEGLRTGYQVLKNGGSIRGFYGMGKSLIALLTAIAKAANGGKPIVIAAYRLRRATGKRELRDLAPSFVEAVNALRETGACRPETLVKWVAETPGLELQRGPREILNGMLKDIARRSFTIEGKGSEKIIINCRGASERLQPCGA